MPRSNASIVPVAPADPPAWRERLSGARNVLSLLLFAAVFTWRSAVSWRRWRRRHLIRAGDDREERSREGEGGA